MLILSNLFGAVRKRQPSDCLQGQISRSTEHPELQVTPGGPEGLSTFSKNYQAILFPTSALHWLILLYKLYFLLIIRTTSLPLLNIPTPPGFNVRFISLASFSPDAPHTHLLSCDQTSPRIRCFSAKTPLEIQAREADHATVKHKYYDRPKYNYRVKLKISLSRKSCKLAVKMNKIQNNTLKSTVPSLQ